MRYGSVCSGIEAASVAWHPLGWTPAWFAEIEAFPSAVLEQRWPGVPNHGDFTRIGSGVNAEPVDVLVGGTPCQSFSVAGKRLGLDDPRGNLTLEFLALAGRLRPRWVVWENVPGVLSDEGGRTFGTVLGLLGKLGYGIAYRVLDAQHFGVPQRRRRVFVVGHLGAWQPAAAVLLEPASMRGDSAPRREAREGVARTLAGGSGVRGYGSPSGSGGGGVEMIPDVAPTVPARTRGGGGLGTDFDCDGGAIPAVASTLTQGVESGGRGGYAGRRREDDVNLIPFDTTQIMSKANRSVPHPGDPMHTLSADGHVPAIAGVTHALDSASAGGATEDGSGRGVPLVPFTLSHGLCAEGFDASEDGTGRGTPLVPFTLAIRGRGDSHDLEVRQDDIANALLTPNGGRGGIGVGAVAFDWQSGGDSRGLDPKDTAQLQRAQVLALHSGMAVRRLTPRECERLQGFPDDYTAITYRGKPAADGPRYRALGNSMAVPVMAWLGRQIVRVEAALQTTGKA
jgi:DNA (cytosine-5)-methyltransferase 1